MLPADPTRRLVLCGESREEGEARARDGDGEELPDFTAAAVILVHVSLREPQDDRRGAGRAIRQLRPQIVDPRLAPDRPPIGPRSAPDRPDLDRAWTPERPQIRRKSVTHALQSPNIAPPKIDPNGPQIDPRWPPNGPQTAPRGTPHRPQINPKFTRNAPKRTHCSKRWSFIMAKRKQDASSGEQAVHCVTRFRNPCKFGQCKDFREFHILGAVGASERHGEIRLATPCRRDRCFVRIGVRKPHFTTTSGLSWGFQATLHNLGPVLHEQPGIRTRTLLMALFPKASVSGFLVWGGA